MLIFPSLSPLGHPNLSPAPASWGYGSRRSPDMPRSPDEAKLQLWAVANLWQPNMAEKEGKTWTDVITPNDSYLQPPYSLLRKIGNEVKNPKFQKFFHLRILPFLRLRGAFFNCARKLCSEGTKLAARVRAFSRSWAENGWCFDCLKNWVMKIQISWVYGTYLDFWFPMRFNPTGSFSILFPSTHPRMFISITNQIVLG